MGGTSMAIASMAGKPHPSPRVGRTKASEIEYSNLIS
eukprot:CAMPEP_0195534012 /NCGR_PEP_ID=MMETSP0794_2-20130614/41640_1 /TAXON_ID=515487 /ORGANISM="Stephanopyxis turris, Strain CCMP 815" /LENGTH=36 /DNA_ID= /DNA_START= /DNA_END= /DNA_ORIENTATION=